MFWFTLSPVDFIYGFYSFNMDININMDILNKKKTSRNQGWPAFARYCLL